MSDIEFEDKKEKLQQAIKEFVPYAHEKIADKHWELMYRDRITSCVKILMELQLSLSDI